MLYSKKRDGMLTCLPIRVKIGGEVLSREGEVCKEAGEDSITLLSVLVAGAI